VYQIAEDWFMRKNGSLFPVSFATSPLFDSKQKADQKRIEYMAFHDELTNLPNLRYINEKLTEDLHTNIPFALLVLDIDRFKHINEALGHAFGDLILQSVACRLKEQLQSQVFVGRLMGDEFAIVFPGLNQEDVWLSECRRIQHLINQPLQVKHLLLNVSVTIGCAMYPYHGKKSDELLKHANMALMEAQQ
jgi:diguanylate cyclase (GGDEF)-like protein